MAGKISIYSTGLSQMNSAVQEYNWLGDSYCFHDTNTVCLFSSFSNEYLPKATLGCVSDKEGKADNLPRLKQKDPPMF